MNPTVIKYHQHIIDDMIKRTTIHDGLFIEFPYFPGDMYNNWSLAPKKSMTWFADFGFYIEENYGAREEEWKPLYLRYIGKCRELMGNSGGVYKVKHG
jgi:hypothetical protein